MKKMCVCRRCLEAIRSHEGYVPVVPYEETETYLDSDNNTGFAVCEWCEEEDSTSELFELI